MKYFSANGILGKGALFNQVFSDRSDGKTFDIKYRALQRFKKHGYVTVYVRRWKSEFSKAMQDTFFNEVFNVYPELACWDVRASKNGIELKPKGTDKPFKYCVYFCPISVSNRLKSNFDSTNIREIDFDEYVPLDGRYAPDEMINLLELYNTCDRDRYIVKLCTFGNRITGTCPFMDFFGITLDVTKAKIRTYRDGNIAIQVYSSDERREVKATSPLAKIVEGTIYDDYMRGGILVGDTAVIRRKPSGASPWARFKTENGCGSIWTDSNAKYYISDKILADGDLIVDKPYGEPGELVVTFGALSEYLKKIYRTSSLYATSNKAWTAFQPIMKIACIK